MKILMVAATMLSVISSAIAGEIWVRASSAGAHLDSNLEHGGGTDDTAILQHLLDRAANGRAVHLVLDGPALVGGLNLYGNTTLECTAGAGLYLKDGSSRAILRNAHRSRGAILDEHVEIRSCFLNGNRKNQPSAALPGPVPAWIWNGPSNKEADGTVMSGLQFLGVNYLNIHDVMLWNIRAFGLWIANANYVDIRNVIVDDGGGENAAAAEYGMTDALHFTGPVRYVSIDSIKVRVGDDAIAFNANDWNVDDLTRRNDEGPYVGQGPISDIIAQNIILTQGTFGGIRILSTNQRVDRIEINNVVGSMRSYPVLSIGHFLSPTSFGNIGRVTLDNVNVERHVERLGPESAEIVRRLRADRPLYGETNAGELPFININSPIESLQIRHVSLQIADPNPVLRFGPDATVRSLDADLTLIDPALLGTVLKLDDGAQVDRLKFALNWQGKMIDEGKEVIESFGGAIHQLQWINTPPLYVGAHAVAGNPASVDVRFSQRLRAENFALGVKLTVNGRSAAVSSAVLQPDGQTVRYRLTTTLKPHDAVNWSYDEREGDLRDLDGIALRSVSPKTVITERYGGGAP